MEVSCLWCAKRTLEPRYAFKGETAALVCSMACDCDWWHWHDERQGELRWDINATTTYTTGIRVANTVAT